MRDDPPAGRFDRRAVCSLLLAAVVGVSTEVLLIDRLLSVAWTYATLCAALSLITAACLGVVAGWWIRRPEWALGIWAALNAPFLTNGSALEGVVRGFTYAVVTALMLRWTRDGWAGATDRGIAVGVGLGLLSYPQALRFVDPSIRVPGLQLLCLAGFAAVLGLSGWYGGWSRERIGAPAWSWLPIGLVSVAWMAASTSGALVDREIGASWPKRAGVVEKAREAPDILLLILDTVRADHLSLYGYERRTTPGLEAFVARTERAVVYPWAIAPGNWTLPTHASLFTGELPSVHGLHGGRGDGRRSTVMRLPLRRIPTLAEMLRRVGYRTGAVFANPLLGESPDLGRGFEVYFQPPPPGSLVSVGERLRSALFPAGMANRVKPYPDGRQINREILRLLESAPSRPKYLVANYMEAHEPMAALPPWAGAFAGDETLWRRLRAPLAADLRLSPTQMERVERRYDEEILALDAYLTELFAQLESRGLAERLWIFVTSDHGEAFDEHGVVAHGTSIYNEQVRVPLVVVPPEGSELPRITDEVSLLDLPATIAEVAGAGSFGNGLSLLTDDAERLARVEFFGYRGRQIPRFGKRAAESARAVIWQRIKLIDFERSFEVYDLAVDPREAGPLTPDQAARKGDALVAFLPPPPVPDEGPVPGTKGDLSPEEKRTLEALGYLD